MSNLIFKHRLYAILSGLLVFFLCVLLLVKIISLDWQRNQANLADQLISRVDAMAVEGAEIISRLEQLSIDGCSDQLLVEMRRDLFLAHFIKDIGYLVDDKLVCTTGLGRFAEPIAGEPPDYISEQGYKIWVDEELIFFDHKISGVIAQKGNFNVVLDFTELGQISNPNLAWELVTLLKGQVIHVHGKRDLFEQDYQASLLSMFHMHRQHLQRCSAQIPYCVAIRGDFQFFANSYLIMMSVLVGFCLLLGVICGKFVSYKLRRSRSLNARVRKGLVSGAFFSLFQPIIDLHTKEVIGCEVLSRFQDELGPIYPDSFIPILREEGLSWPFTQQMVAASLACLERCNTLPDRFKVSVNIFPSDLVQDYFAEFLNIDGVTSTRFELVLEVTEDQHLDKSAAQRNLRLLEEQGFGLSIDDFGMGYSNLNQVQNLNCQVIKIDRSFITDMEEGSIKSSLIPHIVEMAKQLDLSIVAEGIENEMQEKALYELGVQYGQGWAFGKPMKARQLVELHSQYRMQKSNT